MSSSDLRAPVQPMALSEEAVRASEERARRHQEVHDRSPDGMMIFRSVRDEGGRIVDFEWLYSNASASRIVGRRAEDLIGKRLRIEMPGNERDGLFAIYVHVVETGEPHSHEFPYRHEGLDSWFRATSIQLGDGFSVAFTDLTVRRRVEEHAARLAAIVRSSDHAIYSTSHDDVVETWNRGAERLYGYASAEVVGQSILAIIPVQCRAEHEETLRRVLAGSWSVESFHSVRLTKTGRLVPVSIMMSPIGEPDGPVVGVAVVAQDISEQVKLQERLVVADRMTSVGTLAAGMAHEINNPLSSVTVNLDMALEELQLAADAAPAASAPGLREIRQLTLDARAGAERIRKTVRSLMTFTRSEEERRVVVDVKAIADLSVDIAISHLRPCARVSKDYGASPTVLADEARLGQVLIHLLVNAAQAIGEGDVEANEIRITTSTDDTGRAVVEVRDTGHGLPLAVVGRLFDPFFTTRPIGSGAGLGLSVCRNIVTGMGGEITARNNDDRGATFRVVLPAAPAPLQREVRSDPEVSGRRGAVLVVDDEASFGVILARVLREHDVTVLTRASEALALLAAGQHFDLIFADLMMPEMSGAELYQEILARFPDVAPRVVFMTGGAFSRSARTFLDRVANERLSKPFDAQDVRALVQRRLSS